MSRSLRILLTLVVLILLVAVPTGFIVLDRMRPTHRADVVLEIRAPINLISNEPTDSLELQNRKYVTDQIAFLHSHFVLESALAACDVQSSPVKDDVDPIAALASRIQIEQVGKSSFYRISMVGSAEEIVACKNILDAVTGAYLKLRGDREAMVRREVTTVLQELKSRQEQEIVELMERNAALKKAQTETAEQSIKAAAELLFAEEELERSKNVWNLICDRLTKLDSRGEIQNVRLLSPARVRPIDEKT